MENSKKICVILVAGGIGSRFQTAIPKQFLQLKNKPLVRYSFDLFCALPEVSEIVIVCHPQYRNLFKTDYDIKLTFALPGERRQDSVYNALKAMQSHSSLICVHDGVRPFITEELVRRVIISASEHGAATAAMPIKFTIKQSNAEQLVHQTPDRSLFWEIQTPQVVEKTLLEKGFEFANKNQLTVTDDVSLVELLKLPVKLVEGSYRNFKITTKEDMAIAEYVLNNE